MPSPRPLSTTAFTTTPSARTNRQKYGLASRTRPTTVVRLRRSARTASTSAPATAAQTGWAPANEVTTNPASVSPSTTRVNTGTSARSASSVGCAPAARSLAKKRRKTAYSTTTAASQGSAISPANRVKVSPLAANASRLVRLETGSSSEPELARCAHA